MIGEQELIDQIATLEAGALSRWIERGWVVPAVGIEGYAFADVDVARVRLICDLSHDMDIDEDALPIILSLVDQLHDARHLLRVLGIAISALPKEARDLIAARLNHPTAA